METEQKYLLHLLGAYLQKAEPHSADEVDWDVLLSLASIHNVTGIVGYMGKQHKLSQNPKLNGTFRSLCLNTIVLFTQRHAMAEAMMQKLDQAGIDHILIKGFVLRNCYPVPELRTFSDIDMVIRQEDRATTHNLMLSLGFAVKTDWEPVYSYYRGNEYYEIHTQIMEINVSEKADYQSYFANAWTYTTPVSDHSFRFTPEFHLLYILTHIAKHIHGSGAGIRMYMDVAAFLQHYGSELDWPWIEAQLRELKLYDFASVVLHAVECWFGVESPVKFAPVSDELLRDFTTFTLEAGTFGHHNRDDALAKMKHENQDVPTSRAKLLVRLAFPSAETIQARYTYLQDNPWLLPVAWIHRLIKNRADTKNQLKTARQIIQADTNEVDRLKKLTKDIGL